MPAYPVQIRSKTCKGKRTGLRCSLNMGIEQPEVVCEVGSGMNEKRRRLNKILSDSTIGTIIVEHRDRLARMNAGLIESALQAQNRRLIVVDDTEVTDDLVGDMTEVLTSFCARLYGRRAAKNRAEKALAVIEHV